MKIGSDAHRDLFCKHFIATFTPYEPETLPWPELSEEELTRLRTVPFWQEVLHTEQRAGAIVKAFAVTIKDPLVKEAVDLQGFEEARHAALLREMIRRYGVVIEEQPLGEIGPDVETAFRDFGFGECLDSFLGFGAFKLARQSHFLPESMFDIFETLMFEETRHIVFFVNWMAWTAVQNGKGAIWQRHLNSLRYYYRAISRLVGTVRRGQKVNDGKDFSATQASAFLDDFTFRKFVENCYAENRRRMSTFDDELLKPSFMPQLAGMALSSLRFWSFGRGRKQAA
ncbi:MAG TPA: ferritin-like domain-containing protein [Stellaceae bacterium]|nr:ferritin-like domain-containing protein [Stellaceae bacterium]